MSNFFDPEFITKVRALPTLQQNGVTVPIGTSSQREAWYRLKKQNQSTLQSKIQEATSSPKTDLQSQLQAFERDMAHRRDTNFYAQRHLELTQAIAAESAKKTRLQSSEFQTLKNQTEIVSKTLTSDIDKNDLQVALDLVASGDMPSEAFVKILGLASYEADKIKAVELQQLQEQQNKAEQEAAKYRLQADAYEAQYKASQNMVSEALGSNETS